MAEEQVIQPTKIAKSIGIVGSGTAGLIAAIMARRAFPRAHITVISSSDIGIIGVGEGSTEHWRQFMDMCDIPVDELLRETKGTHKYGIRYENWTNHTPDYFHSISGSDDIFAWGYFGTYTKYLEEKKLLTTQTSSVGLVRDKISREHLHNATNQFHFDTFKLNEYFVSLAFKRSVKFIEGLVQQVNLHPETGDILSVKTDKNEVVDADFWIDASGFKRVLMGQLKNGLEWKSFSDTLLCDSAIPFPTESDPNGRIRPYTRARAASSGWMWEIPTQERRGNGYVFSSAFISEDEAIEEAQRISGYKFEHTRTIKFDAGYLRNAMVNNCFAVGLASAFVEPLEATSIGSTIQQMRLIIPVIAAYAPRGSKTLAHSVNHEFQKIMENILTMIRLHYYSDREDSEFWKAMKNMPLTPELEEMINLWGVRPPLRSDFAGSNLQLFHAPHFAHVAQGQGIISPLPCTEVLDNLAIREIVEREATQSRLARNSRELVDHGDALRELYTINDEWAQ